MAKDKSQEEPKEKFEGTEANVEEGAEQNEEGQVENSEEEATEEVAPEEELDEVEKLKLELAEQKDKFIRLYSEFDNFRRRTAKEKIELTKTATENLVIELVQVLDDFERAEKSFGDVKEDDPVKQGFEIVHTKLEKLLEKQGLSQIEEAKGKDLDTDLHEAVTQFPAPSDDLKGKIIDQLEKGYKLGDKVIRYAKVVVGT